MANSEWVPMRLRTNYSLHRDMAFDYIIVEMKKPWTNAESTQCRSKLSASEFGRRTGWSYASYASRPQSDGYSYFNVYLGYLSDVSDLEYITWSVENGNLV